LTKQELHLRIQYVTLGDEEAKRRGSSKSILERKAPPTFEVAVELHDAKTWIIHEDIEQSVDLLLQGQALPLQERKLSELGNNIIHCDLISSKKDSRTPMDGVSKIPLEEKKQKNGYVLNKLNRNGDWKPKKSGRPNNQLKKKLGPNFVFLYIYGVNNQDLKSLIKTLKLPIIVTY
jgi:hypothetical protein